MNGSATLPRVQVIILAAGFSSRLGQPKALARVRAVSLLRRTLTLLAPFAAQMIAVLPRRAARYRLQARGFKVVFAVNPQRAEGLSSSVRHGIRKARYSPAALLLPVDLAALQARDIARLISRWQATRRRVIARRIATPAPLGGAPLILPRWLYARALTVRGDIGLRDLINHLPPQQRVLVDLPSAALDIDTAADLRAARRRRQR
jgi:molybdenum cofactor cytidylyltransferase